MRYGRLVLCLSLLVFPTLGCALGDHVNVSYTAGIPNERPRNLPYTAGIPKEKPGQGHVIYVAKATDDRPITELVGKKWFRSYSLDPIEGGMNEIHLKKGLNLSNIVTSAIADSLNAYGYTVKPAEELDRQVAAQGDTAKVLYTSIQEFWIYYSLNVFNVDANSAVALDFELKDKGAHRWSWKGAVAQKGKVTGFAATESLSEESLNMVFRKAVEDFQRAISSADFKNALMEK
jgi:hypothetical protein